MLLSDLLRFFPSYVLDNFSKLCSTGAVVEPFPVTYEPLNYRGLSYTFCRLLDSELYRNELSKNQLSKRVSQLLENINIESSSLKSTLSSKGPFFTGILLQSPDKRSIESHIKNYIGEGNLTFLLTNELEELKIGFNEIWIDPVLKPKFLWDICDFYITISRIAAFTEQKLAIYPIAHPLPSYLPQSIYNRILLLGLLPKKKELRLILDKISPQFNNCCSKFLSPELDRFTISPSYFKTLISSLPRKKIDPRLRLLTITPLENYVWKGHVYPLPKYKSTESVYLKKQGNFFKQFEDWELLAQVFCLLQPNWQFLWYMVGWSAPLGVVRRLNFLKNEEKWSPSTQAMIEILLKP